MSDWWSSAAGESDNSGVPQRGTTPDQSGATVPDSWDSTAPQPPITPAGPPPLGGSSPNTEQYEPVDFAALGQPASDVGTVDTSKRSKLKSPLFLGGIAAGLLVLCMGMFTAFRFLGGGGAKSPEAVITTMERAVNDQDPVLAATVVDPAELPMLVDLMTEFEGVRERAGLGTKGPVKGTQVEVSDLEVDVDELAPNVARVTLTDGALSASYDLKDTPDQVKTFAGLDYENDSASGSVSVDDFEDEVGAELSAIVVKKGRGWYISPSLTAADLLVESQNDEYESGDFEQYGEVDFFADGADSPEEVIEQLSEAVASGDPEEVAAQLPSDQGQAAVVFQDAAEQLLSNNLYPDNGDPGTFDRNRWKLGRIKTHTEKGPSGTTRLVIDSGKASVIDDYGDKYSLDSDGWKLCAQAPQEDRDCVNVLTGKGGTSDGWGADAPLGRIAADVLGAGPSLLVREVDGGWKLDPVATALDYTVTVMRQLDQDMIESVTVQPLGEPDVTMTAEQKEVAVTFGDTGFASVSIPTDTDEIYSVVVEGVEPEWFAITDPSDVLGDLGSIDGYGIYRGGEHSDSVSRTFIAKDDTTVLGFGGIANSAKKATVRVSRVEIGTAKLDQAVQGSLEGPLALYSMATQADMTYQLEFAASKEATIDVVDGTDDLDSYYLDGSSWDYVILNGSKDDPSEETFTTLTSKSLILVRGEPGTSFSFRATELPQGFEGGGTSKSVTVPGDSYVEVPFDLGGQYSSVSADISWVTDGDIDPTLSIDGLEEDADSSSQYSCPCSEYLSGSGSESGSIYLRNYDSYSITVQLELSIG